jgi:hypothetical protein
MTQPYRSTTLPPRSQSATFSLPVALLIGLAGAVVIASRWLVQTGEMDSFDAVNYILALSHFDMSLHQPQPPGYFLYILIGRFFLGLAPSPTTALLAVSAVFSGLAVVAAYLAGEALFDRRAGILTAALVAVSPFVWYVGVIIAPYTVDLFFSFTLGWQMWRLRESPSASRLWIAAGTLGLAGAIRPQTLVFLTPLLVYSAWKLGLLRVAAGVVLAGGVFCAFFIPSVLISGGMGKFLEAMSGILPKFSATVNPYANFFYPIRYLGTIYKTLEAGLRILTEPAVIFVLLGIFTLPRSRWIFLGLWFIPAWVVYFLIWPGNTGTVLVSIAPFFLLGGIGLAWTIERFKRIGWIVAAGLLLLQAWMFLFMPARPFGDAYRFFENRALLNDLVGNTLERVRLVHDHAAELPPQSTAIMAVQFRLPQFYLPEYSILSYPSFDPAHPEKILSLARAQGGRIDFFGNLKPQAVLPPGTDRLILFDLLPKEMGADPALTTRLERNHHFFYLVQAPPGQILIWDGRRLGAAPGGR